MKPTILIAVITLASCAALRASEPPKGEPTNAAEAAAQEAAAKKAKADAETDAKYQALVATLPADQQEWERTLQANLGGFYLPIHKRLRVEGRSSCWDFVQDAAGLTRVLLIGDSVSGGYTLSARKALAGKANVHKAPENCGPTANGLKKLDVWLGGGKWDVIHFNFGLHDSKTPVAEYEGRLREIVARLKQTGATLIWASTTPRPADGKEGPAFVTAVIERNEIAARVMKENGIATDDLYAAVLPHQAEMQNPQDVHFNAKGYEFLGLQVATAIESVLKSKHRGVTGSTASLPDLHPVLGKRGKLIASADFETPPAEGALKGFGDYSVTGGVLHQQQKEGQDHNPVIGLTSMCGLDKAAQRAFELKGCILQFDFKAEQVDYVGVDFMRKAGGIKPGEPVPEKGGISYPAGAFPPVGKGAMIFPPFVTVAFELPGAKNRYKEARLVIKDTSKFQPVQAALPLKIQPGEFVRVLIEVRGEQVAVQLSNGQVLKVNCAEAGASKQTPYFYAIEQVGRSVDYDNVKLWEIE